MNGKFSVFPLLIMLLFVMFMLVFQAKPADAATTITVPDDYSTIQEATNNANDGDTVFVRAATYNENIILNVSISLIGEARETTIVDVRGIGNPLEITANRTIVSGFTFSYGGVGITMTDSHNNLIQNNIMRKNSRGIGGSLYTNTILENNIVTENDYGIDFGHLSGPSSRNNTARKNEIHHNANVGIYVSAYEGNNSIVWNSIHDNVFGIVLDHTQNNSVFGNLINYNTYGIYMRNAIQDTIAQNQLQGNVVGIHLENSNGNAMFHNNFVSNTAQVEGISYNIWDNGYPSGGNYWSGYSGLDLYNGPSQNLTGSDGIGDTVYGIDADNIDRYPLMYQWPDLTPPITNDDYDNQWHSTNITITLVATDNGQGVAETYYKINDGPTETISLEGQPMITTESANNTLEYWSIDKAGNEETHHYLAEIKLDKTAPEGSIIIDNGALYTNSTSVTLNLTAIDTTSGVHQMRFSNDGVWDTEPWELFLQTKSWTLTSGDGPKKVYFQIKDNAGLVSNSYSSSILLDATNPSISSIMRDPSGDVQPNQLVKISVNVSDSLSGVDSVKLVYFTNRSSIGLEFPMMLNQTSGLYERTILVQEAGTLVRYQITAYDNAGNNVTDDNAGQYYVYTVIPEFLSFLILPLFMIATLLAATMVRPRQQKPKLNVCC